MKVTLLSSTPDALDVLLFTKNTRLTMNGATLEDIRNWDLDYKMSQLEYMRNTIQSSWEFVDYVFAIEGVTRAFTQQLERHRIGTSFAEQSLRAVEMTGFEYLATGVLAQDGHSDVVKSGDLNAHNYLQDRAQDVGGSPANVNDWVMWHTQAGYAELINRGVAVQDARGVLPMNILTNITFKANLRTLHEMGLKRLCVRTQGEFQDVFRAILAEVERVHPWAERFIRVQCAWNGTCLFPLLPLDKCFVKPHVYNPETGLRYDEALGHNGFHLRPKTTEEIYQLHRARRQELQPNVVKKQHERVFPFENNVDD